MLSADQTKYFLIMRRIKMHMTHLFIFVVAALACIARSLKNEAVIAGLATQMTCGEGTNRSPFWFHRSSAEAIEQILYDSLSIKLATFNNTNATGELPGQFLSISPAHLQNAGVFRCTRGSTQLSAQLIVLESQPVCGGEPNASHPDFVDLWCRVNFTGFWPPHMQWIQGDRKLTSQKQRLSTSLSSTLTVKAESFGGDASYICKTYFVEEDNPLKDEKHTVTNVPNFTFATNSDSFYNPSTKDGNLAIEPTTRYSPNTTNGIMWILTSCAALACLVVFVVIVYYIRKHPDVCKKFAEPDLVQNAELIQIENRVDVHPHGLELDFEAEEPEHICGNNVDYAEVVCCERKLPSHMQDSPAWNNLHNGGACGKSIQNSPAWSHSSKGLAKSRCATPGNGSPMVSIEDVHYLDINTVATIPVPQAHAPRRPPARLPAFHAASYASIDHTSRPPPPLPPGDD